MFVDRYRDRLVLEEDTTEAGPLKNRGRLKDRGPRSFVWRKLDGGGNHEKIFNHIFG